MIAVFCEAKISERKSTVKSISVLRTIPFSRHESCSSHYQLSPSLCISFYNITLNLFIGLRLHIVTVKQQSIHSCRLDYYNFHFPHLN